MMGLVLMVFLCLIPVANATDYQELSIERRQNSIKEAKRMMSENQPMPETKQTSDSFEQEKRTISQQLAVITGDEDTKYHIVQGDTLQVAYKDQGNRLENIYQVNNEGSITLPLVGTVNVVGMNRGQARAHLNELMSEYIRDPQLTIQINTSGKYTILGAAGPGVYELQPNIKLMEALVKAGIDQNRANLSNVLVMRVGKDKPEILKLNIKKMMRKGDRSDDITLKPNDLIYVPNSFFYDFDTFKDKMFEYLADYYTLGADTILKPKQKQSPLTTTTTTTQ